MQSFTVKRSEWLRGEGTNASRLLRPIDGKKCCVGFFAEQIFGCDRKSIQNIGSLSCALNTATATFSDSVLWQKVSSDIYRTNDNMVITETSREAALRNLFAVVGYEILFVD